MTVSQFAFVYPSPENQSNGNTDKEEKRLIIDKDGDLIVERKRTATIRIAHQLSTELQFVGLQVWRGALILADFVSRHLFVYHELEHFGNSSKQVIIARNRTVFWGIHVFRRPKQHKNVLDKNNSFWPENFSSFLGLKHVDSE